MPSNARKKFDENARDIDQLIDLYKGVVTLYKYQREAVPEGSEVLFRSAIVLMVSHWEAYVEDICGEALDHLVTHVSGPTKLPKEIKKHVAREIKASKNEIEVWRLAGQGWKNYLHSRMSTLRLARNRSFSTPRAQHTAEFIRQTIGIEDIRESWNFDGKDSTTISRQLDNLVEIRGEIAHRGRVGRRLDAEFVTDHTAFLRKLVSKTGGQINKYVKQISGAGLF